MYNILAIFGKSGVGKDTLLKALKKEYHKNIHTIVSYTTRPKRDGEKDGIDYHFVDKMGFATLKTQNKLLESSCFNNWYYGTGIDDLESSQINIGVFNPEGIDFLIQREEKEKDVHVFLCYLDCYDKIRLIRCLNRETSPDVKEIIRRYQTDEEDFNNLFKKYPNLNMTYIQTGYNNFPEQDSIKDVMGEAIKYFNLKNDIL